jgi:hypothetical protein
MKFKTINNYDKSRCKYENCGIYNIVNKSKHEQIGTADRV